MKILSMKFFRMLQTHRSVVKDKQLVGIAVGEGRENMFMNDEQFAAFTKQIIETQDMGVDAVSGATVDCQAITGGIMTAFSHKTS